MAYDFLSIGSTANDGTGTPARTVGSRLKARFNTSPLTPSGGLIATDASMGGFFDVTVAGDVTLSNPTNMVDGQQVVWRITHSGAGNVITLGTDFRVPDALVDDQSTPAADGAKVRLIATYNATDSKWDLDDVIVTNP